MMDHDFVNYPELSGSELSDFVRDSPIAAVTDWLS